LARQRRRKDSEGAAGPRLPVRLRYPLLVGAVVAVGMAAGSQLGSLVARLDRQFPVTGVAVAGEPRREDPQVLARWLGREVEGGFFTADLERLQRAVSKRPWVRTARLRRHWPGTLVVAIDEHRAMARWRPAAGEDWRLVSRRGKVFRPKRPPQGRQLPRLQGPRPRLADLRQRMEVLKGRLDGRHSVSALSVDRRGDWTARLDGRVTVHFGRDHWERRLDRLVRVDRDWRLLERKVARVDLRYPDGLAVAVADDEGSGDADRAGLETGGRPSAARL